MSYSPLHMFGAPNATQNLTFADGESGYSYNDKNGGTYLWFTHAGMVITYTDNDTENNTDTSVTAPGTPVNDSETIDQEAKEPNGEDATAVSGSALETDLAGTAKTGGMIALVGFAGLVAGCFIGAVFTNSRRKENG